MCMCEIDIDLCLVLDGIVSGQTGITVSCIQHIIQVYLKKNKIYNFFQSLNVMDKIIILFIQSCLVSMVTEFIK